MRPDETRITLKDISRCCIMSIGKQMQVYQEQLMEVTEGSTVKCEECETTFTLKDNVWTPK